MSTRSGSLIALALAVSSPSFAAEFPPESRVSDRIVAIVNTEPVTLFELRRAAAPNVAMAVREAQGDEQKLDKALKRVVQKTLDALVDDILIADEAKQMDLTVSAEKVDAHINKIKEQNGWSDDDLAAELKKLGFASIADYRRHTEREMLKSQVVGIKVASRVKVDESAVDAALATRTEGGQVEERKAAHVLVRMDELAQGEAVEKAKALLEAARDKINKGETTFAAVAKDLSDDSNKSAGGDLGWFVQGDFDPDFEKVAFALPKGEVSAPFRTRYGLHIVVIEDIRKKSLSADGDVEAMKRQIRYELREKELERVYSQWVKGLRTEAFVQVKDLGLGDAPVEPAPEPEPEPAPEPEPTPDT